MVLVTSAAFHAGNAIAIRTAMDVHGVPMAFISLAREVAAGVAIHAAGMMKHGDDGFEGSSGGGIIMRGRSRNVRRLLS